MVFLFDLIYFSIKFQIFNFEQLQKLDRFPALNQNQFLEFQNNFTPSNSLFETKKRFKYNTLLKLCHTQFLKNKINDQCSTKRFFPKSNLF